MRLNIKNKDDIMTRLIEKFDKKNQASTDIAKSVIHGEILSLLWCVGFINKSQREEQENKNDEEFSQAIDQLTKKGEK